jgi:hypothetical protein
VRNRILAMGLFVGAMVGCAPAAPAKAPGSVLPLRALRLYETGVGYFERSGEIGAATATSLPVPAGHLDDALKSLVVLNGGAGGQVSGLSFASSVSKGVARGRAGLPVDVDQPITYRDLLVSLKGEQVEISTGGEPVLGRVIEVIEEPADPPADPAREGDKPGAARPPPSPPPLVPVVTLLTDKGEIAKIKGAAIQRVRPIDPAFAGRLDRALDALSTRSAQQNRPLSLLGDAHGAITFGYIAETPLWRTTYRLLLSPGEKGGVLQGWALVHNDTDERWQSITLSLVNGQPDSFVFPLAAPRYARRTLVHPDDPLSTIPQLQDQTADMLWGDNADSAAGGAEGYGSGFGSGHGRLGGVHFAKAPTVRMGSTTVETMTVGKSALLSVGNLADLATAPGAEHGALFTYTAASPFSLDAHSSALVPILETKVDVEPLAWFADVGSRARIAVRFSNSTGQTLPAGTLAVFAAGGFAGEGALDRLKPDERRFVQFGNELDAEVTETKSTSSEEPKRLTFSQGRLEEHFLRTSRLTWELENRSTAARAFYVGLAVDRNTTIKGVDGVDFDEKGTRAFEVVEGLSRSTRFDVLTEKQLRELAATSSLPAAEAAVAGEAAAKARDAEGAARQVEAASKEIAAIKSDVERFREHLKALGGDKGGGGAVAAPLVKRLLDAEDRLAAATKRLQALEKERAERTDAVRAVLAKLPTGA